MSASQSSGLEAAVAADGSVTGPSLLGSSDAPNSLVSACYTSLTTAPLDHARLEQLPQHMLVQLIAQLVVERDQEKATRQQHEEELARLVGEERRYVIDPPTFMHRVDWDDIVYKRVEAVMAKWVPRPLDDDFAADELFLEDIMFRTEHPGRVAYNKESKTISFMTGPKRLSELDLWYVMSSAMLLYRLCCLFSGLRVHVKGPAGYKYVWTAEVQHVATGGLVNFGEHKGASHVSASHLQGPKEFLDDMLELLNLLYDEKCLHPYDGLVAGCVA